MTPEEATKFVNRAGQAARDYSTVGDDGRHLVGTIRQVIETDAWRKFKHPGYGSIIEYGDGQFREFLETKPASGLGVPSDRLVSVLDIHDHELAARVRDLLTPAAARHGGDRKSDQVSDTHLITQESRDAAAIVARLKRDDQALAAEVAAGKISANAAAIAAGIRHKYARIRTDDVQRAVNVLLKTYTRNELIDALEKT